jgi:hypothetical protein
MIKQEGPGGSGTDSFVVLDSAGVMATAIRRRPFGGDRPTVLVEAMLKEDLLPQAHALAELLEAAEAIGRAAADVWVLLSDDDIPTTIGSSQLAEGSLHVSREITIPASADEVEDLARSWHREIQRNMGIAKYEGESAPSGG